MTRGRKRVPSSIELSINPKQLRKSSSAEALNQSLNNSTRSTDLDNMASSQPVGSLSSVSVNNKIGRDNQNKTTTAGDDSLCGHCDTPITIFEILFLKCCFCTKKYHSCCLEIDESLEQYLYVVTDVGGWSCPTCRATLSSDKTAKSDTGRNKNSSMNNIDNLQKLSFEIKALQAQIQSLSEVMSKTNTESSPERNIINSAKIFKPSYTQIVTKHQPASTQFTELSHDLHSQSTGREQQAKKSTSTSIKSVDAVLASNFENQFKTAVLSAVHSEMKSFARRSTSIVVSGFHKRSTVSDKDHFIKFCSQFYEFEPKIVSTRRLGRDENNKVQPLLITFADTSEPEYLVNNARWLRSVSDEYVRNNIFINKHLTYAERKAAFVERLL